MWNAEILHYNHKYIIPLYLGPQNATCYSLKTMTLSFDATTSLFWELTFLLGRAIIINTLGPKRHTRTAVALICMVVDSAAPW